MKEPCFEYKIGGEIFLIGDWPRVIALAPSFVFHPGNDPLDVGDEFTITTNNAQAVYLWESTRLNGDLICRFVKGVGPDPEHRLQ